NPWQNLSWSEMDLWPEPHAEEWPPLRAGAT
ncbi:MAG: hypothetical protein RLZZ295_949, partial [Actinomycetota bacterium]